MTSPVSGRYITPMKASTFLIGALSLLISAAGLQAETRTWTSAADPSKTFDGELVGVDGANISVKRSDGQVMTFPLTVVSAADQAYVKEKQESLPKPADRGPVAREISGALAGNQGSLATAEYFIIWCAANR